LAPTCCTPSRRSYGRPLQGRHRVRLVRTVRPGAANGHPAARAGVQDVVPARRVLAQRGTVASVPAEFKTMALPFWGRSSIRYRTASRLGRSGSLVLGALVCRSRPGRKVWQEGCTFTAPASGQTGRKASVFPHPVVPSGLVLRPRSGRCSSPSCPYGSV